MTLPPHPNLISPPKEEHFQRGFLEHKSHVMLLKKRPGLNRFEGWQHKLLLRYLQSVTIVSLAVKGLVCMHAC